MSQLVIPAKERVKKSKLSERGLLYRLARCGQHRTLSICGAKFVLFRDCFTGAAPLGFRFLDFFTHSKAGIQGQHDVWLDLAGTRRASAPGFPLSSV